MLVSLLIAFVQIGVILVVLIAVIFGLLVLLGWLLKMYKKEVEANRKDMMDIVKESNERDKEYSKNESDQSILMKQITDNQRECFNHCQRGSR